MVDVLDSLLLDQTLAGKLHRKRLAIKGVDRLGLEKSVYNLIYVQQSKIIMEKGYDFPMLYP